MRYFNLLLFFALTAHAWAQDWSESAYKVGTDYPGYIITLEGDTTKGWIQALYPMSLEGNQNTCVFYTDSANDETRTKYGPKDLYAYYIKDKFYKSMNYSGGLLDSPVRFVLQTEPGQIASYTWYDGVWEFQPSRQPDESQEDYFGRIYESGIIYQKGDEDPVEHESFALGFKNKMAEFVSDHEELADKVENKEKGYKLLNMLDIIAEYNEWYAENN